LERIIDGKRYSTITASLVASNRYWDGSNWDRSGRCTYLYKTARGNFFLHHTTRWQGERDTLEAISEGEAKSRYEGLPEHEMEYEDAFGQAPEEA